MTSAGPVGEPGPGPSLLVLRALPAGDRRESATRLLLRAGRSEPYVRASCEQGQVFGFAGIEGDSHDGPVGALLSVPTGGARTAELRIVALAPGAAQLGTELLAQFADSLRARGLHRIVAPASNLEVVLIRLLLAAGYRFLRVERDACTPERGFADDADRQDPHRDLVWLELEL